MSGQHREIPPDDCRSCRNVLADAEAEQHAAPSIPSTVAERATRCGLGIRAYRVHSAHLLAHGRLMADRRTPTGVGMSRGRAVPEHADALMWAACQRVRDVTCGRCLKEYARAAGTRWSGQLGTLDLAATLSIGERTARTHRGHLVTDRLIRFTPDVTTTDSGHRVRRPDRFTLLSGIVAAPMPDPGGSYLDDVAAELLAELEWWRTCRVTKRDAERARQAIIRSMRNGWDVKRLAERLERLPDAEVRHPYGRLRMLLPELDEVPVLTAQEAVTGPLLERSECRACHDPAPSGADLCGVTYCKDPAFADLAYPAA